VKRTAVVEDMATWSVGIQHRCSQPHCENPAVAVNRKRGYRHITARYWCDEHLAVINRFVRSHKVWWRVAADSPLADIGWPWPPRKGRR
jgi:hypothetical protein